MSSITTSTIPAGTTWTADPVHSHVGFAVRHMVVSTFRTEFADHDATLVVGEDGALRLNGRVRAGSIAIRDESLAAIVRGADFLDTERFPEIAFASTLVRDAGGELVVEGELTIKGITRPIRATGTLTEPHVTFGDVLKVGLELEATIDRTEYGLTWHALLPKGGAALGNEVTLQVGLELVQA